MNNSINFNHDKNIIQTSNDGKLYIKYNNKWNLSNSVLYKKENEEPSLEIGKNGDYYANYMRNYNYVKYSNSFLEPYWVYNQIKLSKEYNFIMVDDYSNKLIPSIIESEHSLTYTATNNILLSEPLTFSLYVSPNELNRICLSMLDDSLSYGIKVIYNLASNSMEFSNIGNNEDKITNISYNIEKINNYYRIWITSKFTISTIIKLKINAVNNSNELVFSNTNTTDGIFISGAQLDIGNKPYTYFSTTNNFSSYITLKQLYRKNENVWNSINNKIYYISELDNNIGEQNDICCLTSFLKFDNPLRLGFGEETLLNDEGEIIWNETLNNYIIKGKKGNYTLMLNNDSKEIKSFLTSVTFSNKTYQTWNSPVSNIHSIRYGFNTGGNYNFWTRNIGHTRY